MHVCSEKERIVYQTQSVCKSLLVDDTILEPSLTPAALHIIDIKLLITISVKVDQSKGRHRVKSLGSTEAHCTPKAAGGET